MFNSVNLSEIQRFASTTLPDFFRVTIPIKFHGAREIVFSKFANAKPQQQKITIVALVILTIGIVYLTAAFIWRTFHQQGSSLLPVLPLPQSTSPQPAVSRPLPNSNAPTTSSAGSGSGAAIKPPEPPKPVEKTTPPPRPLETSTSSQPAVSRSLPNSSTPTTSPAGSGPGAAVKPPAQPKPAQETTQPSRPLETSTSSQPAVSRPLPNSSAPTTSPAGSGPGAAVKPKPDQTSSPPLPPKPDVSQLGLWFTVKPEQASSKPDQTSPPPLPPKPAVIPLGSTVNPEQAPPKPDQTSPPPLPPQRINSIPPQPTDSQNELGSTVPGSNSTTSLPELILDGDKPLAEVLGLTISEVPFVYIKKPKRIAKLTNKIRLKPKADKKSPEQKLSDAFECLAHRILTKTSFKDFEKEGLVRISPQKDEKARLKGALINNRLLEIEFNEIELEMAIAILKDITREMNLLGGDLHSRVIELGDNFLKLELEDNLQKEESEIIRQLQKLVDALPTDPIDTKNHLKLFISILYGVSLSSEKNRMPIRNIAISINDALSSLDLSSPSCLDDMEKVQKFTAMLITYYRQVFLEQS
jgi:hypothetical protein